MENGAILFRPIRRIFLDGQVIVSYILNDSESVNDHKTYLSQAEHVWAKGKLWAREWLQTGDMTDMIMIVRFV